VEEHGCKNKEKKMFCQKKVPESEIVLVVFFLVSIEKQV
jgi:hypothetical protein